MQRKHAARPETMGIRLAGLLAVFAFAGVSAPARADLRLLDYTGTLTFAVTTIAAGAGAGAAVSPAITHGGHLSSIALPGGFAPITTSVPVTSSATIQSLRFTGLGNLGATISGISGGPPLGSGTMGMQGMLKVCIFTADCVGNIPVPLTPTPGGAGMGIGGTQTLPGAVALTLQHNPWTIGQAAMTIHTANSNVGTPTLPGGFAHGPASLTTSTARFSGVVQLVTASKVYTSLTGAFPELPIYAVMNLHLVPEPGTLLLLGSGVAALAALGRRRRSG